ncbi:hypothetical protein [Methylobacterium planeticum]|uniref:Flagellin n=1 Tax=Methylobacterium planeticum TaxID=2615211 RepID=A0A6N6MRN3_9HYPH|nr:hypothetical protein [Methylobacterium planeticum]KAB1073870.1 hypothetical protein F6X51_09020 [Methylobacterium planeticum]
MTTIGSFAAGSYITNRNTANLVNLKSQLDGLTTQLTTGRASETYGGLGSDRSTSLSAHATLSALDGYDSTITGAQTRVKLASASMTQITSLTATLRKSIDNSALNNGATAANNALLARNSLDSALDALNQQSAGQYLFGGRAIDSPPVVTSDVLLNGDASNPAAPLAGLKTLVTEQMKADQGSGAGRLTQSYTAGATSVSVSEEADPGARANFGFTLAAAPTASSAFATVSPASITSGASTAAADPTFAAAPNATDAFRVVVNQADGSQATYDLTGADLADISTAAAAKASLLAKLSPGKLASVQSAAPPNLTATFPTAAASPGASFSIDVASQPAVGDSITIKLALRDGTTTTLTLQAQSKADATSTSGFTIGATPAETAQNLSDTLQRALKYASDTTLAASSTTRATEDFFAGSNTPGLAPRRIDFSGSAPTFSQAASAKTVIWYKGEASATDARASVTARIGANSTTQLGARANEPAIKDALSAFAAAALSDVGTTTTTSADRWKAVAARATNLLPASGGLEEITADFSLAASSLGNAAAQNKTTRATLQSAVDGVESVTTEEVAAKLLAVQNQLQASYQVTSMLSKLSLVNYLS